MNKVLMMGRLTRDPESKTTPSGRLCARMSLAVDRPGKKVEGKTNADFITLIAWEKTAELAGKYLAKGSQILVEGRLQVRNYEDQQGQKRTITDVVVERIEFAGSKPEAKNDNGGWGAPADDTPF